MRLAAAGLAPVQEYLLSYGNAGDFGRFHPVKSMSCRRGDRAVIRSSRGLELGTVLCSATPGHAIHLPNTTVGQLLRLANADDEEMAARMYARSQDVFNDGRELAAALNVPLEILDVEVLLDGQQAVVHHVRWGEADVRPFVSKLSKKHGVQIALYDLTRTVAEPEEEHGCGKPNCGSGKGGCGSCSEGGGCGSCGSKDGEADLQAYFAGLREQMHAQDRMPLL